MSKNPILDELHKTRERLLAEAGGTLDGLVAQLQQDERRSDREFLPPRDGRRHQATATVSNIEGGESQTSPGGSH